MLLKKSSMIQKSSGHLKINSMKPNGREMKTPRLQLNGKRLMKYSRTLSLNLKA